jgi:hypothetical protein
MKELDKIEENFNHHIKHLENRLKYCEAVAKQYEEMYNQLKKELAVLSDRQGNIQQVYDYMTRIGSQIAVKNPDKTTFLNPLKKELSMDKEKEKKLELLKKFKFKVHDIVFYVNEPLKKISQETIYDVRIYGKHPRYFIQGQDQKIIGNIDECNLFKDYSAALDELEVRIRDSGRKPLNESERWKMNPLKTHEEKMEKRLEIINKSDFRINDKVFYLDEGYNKVFERIIDEVDIFYQNTRYRLKGTIGYVDESHIFKTEAKALAQLEKWNRSEENDRQS